MGPTSVTQIRWGVGTCVGALAIVALLAFAPDPLFRYRVLPTMLDDVDGIAPGTRVHFRGADVGEVRSIALNPEDRRFIVRLSVLRQWHPAACSFVTVASSTPFIAPRIELVAPEGAGPSCGATLAAANCVPVLASLPVGGQATPALIGCKRAPDLIQTASVAVQDAANVARTASVMAGRLQAMLQGSGGGASPVDIAGVAQNATATLAALNSLSTQLDHSLRPGHGDVALTLANVRRMTGRASEIDMASLNGILKETRTLVTQNQASIQGILAQGQGGAVEARAMLQDAAQSLTATSTNLQRITDSLGDLSDHAAGDPTILIRGRRFADPPAPGAGK